MASFLTKNPLKFLSRFVERTKVSTQFASNARNNVALPSNLFTKEGHRP